jgi:catechol 2,3-dioxygenase
MTNLTHMGIFTDRRVEMQEFYGAVLGLVVSDSGVGNHFKRRITFMTGSADHHHQFVLVEREADDPPGGALFQVSFEMNSLDEVRAAAARARAAGARDVKALDHGNAWSVYFKDPDGNLVEIYTDTVWYVPQPFADPLDLTLPDEEIRRLTDERVRTVEGAEPVASWREKIEARLTEAQK